MMPQELPGTFDDLVFFLMFAAKSRYYESGRPVRANVYYISGVLTNIYGETDELIEIDHHNRYSREIMETCNTCLADFRTADEATRLKMVESAAKRLVDAGRAKTKRYKYTGDSYEDHWYEASNILGALSSL